ncbi:molybdenum cofactor guanylyltransferase [Paenibacillus sp. CF384]|uniref:molybdenum cofactor guanylyltransferase n=1 Tax=Paenibacillus sp. CF384 TaxID=1884382 RepID=UPI00089D32DE|nr:molybdenum cofactor guanylyltransferase [Paenibacillus sp. CF384]SDX25182.1 molybdopterin-guanine dinucleotide biosynthesis protein A [Paenibacillus sp. CF384]
MSIARSKVTGIILAGGRSSRMGSDKALLPIGTEGDMILKVVAEQMLALGMPNVVVSVGDSEREDVYRTQLKGLPGQVQFVHDAYPDCGPLAGLHAALSAMQEPGYGFVMACDMPVLSGSLLGRMLELASEETALRPEAGVSQVIRTANQPFHALYHTSVTNDLQQRLERRELRLMSLLDAMHTVEVKPLPDEEAAFVNLNTRELYADYVRAKGHFSL